MPASPAATSPNSTPNAIVIWAKRICQRQRGRRRQELDAAQADWLRPAKNLQGARQEQLRLKADQDGFRERGNMYACWPCGMAW